MAKFAMCTGYTAALDTQEQMTLNMDSTFFNTDGQQVVTQSAVVTKVFDATDDVDLIHEAIVDAIVAYAQSAYGWIVPRSRVLYPVLARGSTV
jgi:hypothetical protein